MLVVEVNIRRSQGAHFQTGQERKGAFSDWFVCWDEVMGSQLMNTVHPVGVILRDSHGVAQVRHITGNKILRILKAKGVEQTCV